MKIIVHHALIAMAKHAQRSLLVDRGRAMSALGHVWTAPWQGLSDVTAALSGAVTCPAY
jgi:hypothetical protein